MNKLKEFYKSNFYIPPLDLADSAESNRINTFFLSRLFFILCTATLALICALCRNNLQKHASELLFYVLCEIDTLAALLLALIFKNVSRKNAWILKNIPLGVLFSWGVASGSYLCYSMGRFFEGILTFFLSTCICLCAFSFPPLFFIPIVSAGVCAIAPYICKEYSPLAVFHFGYTAAMMFCLLFYKRRSEKKFLSMITGQKKRLEAKTFGNFTLLYEGKAVKFSRSKTTELVAYLICKNGSSANTSELLCALYGEYADSARYGSSLRVLISDAKHTFSELEIQNFFSAEYNNFRINPEAVKCDYYDFLSGDKAAKKLYAGQFMSQYSWAEETAAFLERKALAG